MPTAPPAVDTRKPAPAPPAKSAADKAATPAPAPAKAAGPPAANGQQRLDRLAVRAKLAVSEPGDAVEREADAIADKVTRMPDSEAAARPAGTAATSAIRRKPDDGAGKASAPPPRLLPVQAVSGAETIRRQADADGVSGEGAEDAADRPATTQELLDRLGPGGPLDDDVRASLESRMGAWFGDVRIHNDDRAAQMAAQLDARAFAYGHHIAFAAGAYRPRTAGGRHLLAHELAHVMQQSGGVTRAVMRKKAATPPVGPAKAAVDTGDFVVTKTALELPPIKARHHGAYQLRAAKNLLKREAGYDAATRGTRQAANWATIVPDIDKIPRDQRPDAASGWQLVLELGQGTLTRTIKGTSKEDLAEQLKLPNWNLQQSGLDFQIDHLVEIQLDGPDDLDNLELLSQRQNGSVGSSLNFAIKRALREEIAIPASRDVSGREGLSLATAKKLGAQKVLDTKNVVFQKVAQRDRNSRVTERGTDFWSRQQIEHLDHVVPVLTRQAKVSGSNSRFLLFSPTGNLLIAALDHKAGRNIFDVPEARAGAMAGFLMERVSLNAGYNAQPEGAAIGTIAGSLNLGPLVQRKGSGATATQSLKKTRAQAVSIGITQKKPGAWSGATGAAAAGTDANDVEFTPLSPMTIANLRFGQGVQGDAVIHPTHPALAGLAIPAAIENGRLGLFHTLDAGALASRLAIPGLHIDAASVTFGYDGAAFSVAGGVEFSIDRFGEGTLNASMDNGAFGFTGGFTADPRLFDEGHLELWYRKKGGFGGRGRLGISTPGRIKGIKSATIEARYEDSVFSAKGTVAPDIPGLQSASLSVRYADDGLQIEGDLAIDDKMPCVESANVHVAVVQSADGWKVAANGSVVPKLPRLKGPRLDFSYDDGIVLLQGTFHIGHDDDTLEGDVSAGITNAPVGPDGRPQLGGAGVAAREFHLFGNAKIRAKFHDGKIVGLLDLRLLPDGSLRVGGGFELPTMDIFPQVPKPPGDELFREPVSTPEVGIPGMGFSVGGVSVGLTVYASASASAHASIGPATLVGLHVEVGEFDPDAIDLAALEISGGGRLQIHGSAGFGLEGSLHLALSAAVVSLDASIGLDAEAQIPQEPPIVDAATDFTYSRAKGLDLHSSLDVNLQPELSVALKGDVAVKLNLLVKKVTLWSHDFTIGEANYKLPIAIKGHGEVGYNSRTDSFTPANPAEALKVDKPHLGADDFIAMVKGDPAPTTIKTTDATGKELGPEELMNAEPAGGGGSQDDGYDAYAGDAMMLRSANAHAVAPPSVDEGIVARLGPGQPLDLATRGFFEQRMQTDLSGVRIHVGPAAARETRALDALAFTIGSHIAFAPGRYAPDTPDGRELLAHEMAHVLQQQGGAARQVARATTPPVAPGTAASTAPVVTGTGADPGAPVAGLGPITLPTLKLPELKYGSAQENSHRKDAYDRALPNIERPAGYRRADLDSQQGSHWTHLTPADRMHAMLATRVSGLVAGRVYVAVPRALSLDAAANAAVVGTPEEIALALRQPRWDKLGNAEPTPFEIDHIVELQLGGIGFDDERNLELLERSANGASGRAIDRALNQAFSTYATSPAAAALPAADRNAEALRSRYRVRFAAFSAQGAPTIGRRWTQAEVQAGDPAAALHFYDPSTPASGASHLVVGAPNPWPHNVDATPFTGSPTVLVLYASQQGGAALRVPLVGGQPANPAGALQGWLPGFDVRLLTLTLDTGAAGAIGTIRGHLKHDELAANAKTDVDVTIQRRPGLANAGVLNLVVLRARLRTLLRDGGVKKLSPVVVDDVDVQPGIGLVVTGRVEPTIAMLRPATLNFALRGDDLQVSKTFSAGEIMLGGPLHVDASDLTVTLGNRSGLQVAGNVGFGIARLGQGTLHGNGASSGFSVGGRFDFDRSLFDGDASIQLGYRRGPDAPDGKLSGAGDLAIGPGKVRGIRRAAVHAAFDGDQRAIAGTADLDIPGVESADLGVEFTPAGDTVIQGNARFRDRPGLRNGRLAATLTGSAGSWGLAASGGADAQFAGFDARLDASFADGLFMFSADAPFAVGQHVSGRVRVGLTNGGVDEQGRLVEGSAPAAGAGGGGELRPFGNGNVHVRLTDGLAGDFGLRVRPDGGVRVNGGLGIARPLTVFEQFPSPARATRTLLTMPTVSVPLVGVSVAGHTVGIALAINGRVDAHAFVGPGRVTQTELRIDDFDPADPASLRVAGGATFDLPAEAGIDAGFDAGLSLGAAIIAATAGINLTASAVARAQVSPHVDLAWTAAAGLHLHADLDASLSPRLAFDVNGFAEVTADAFVHTFTLWRKDWNLAHREIGSGLALQMNAPVDYFSDGRGVVFDPGAVSFDVPPLGLDTLRQAMNGDGGSERTTRARDA